MYSTLTSTVESVTSGHPDKVCDQISDAILDMCLRHDPRARVAIETFGSKGLIVVGGEVTASVPIDFETIARSVYRSIGYLDEPRVIVNVSQQSPDIAQGVNTGGAGDQGIMYGYATDETPEYLPRSVVLVHRLAGRLEELRRAGAGFLGPDGKTQITLQDGRLRTVLVSVQNTVSDQRELHEFVKRNVIAPVIGDPADIEVLVNPTGAFTIGGFASDTGLTGRKIMVDTYCGLVPHGGGAFSGKDPTKVDRSAAYMARFAAKNLVARGYGRRVLVSVAYAIGRADPLMLHAVNETGRDLSDVLARGFDFRPQVIIERLGLRRPLYLQTAAYGHFGKPDLPWEAITAAS